MLEHKWHPSHQSENFQKALVQQHSPARPLRCRLCGWKGSADNVCTVCLDMVKTLLERPTHYWLDLESRDKIRQRLRQQEEGPLGFTY